MPINNREPWTTDDVKWLRVYAKGKMSAREIATTTGRTVAAIKFACMSRRIRLKSIKQPRVNQSAVQLKVWRKRRRANKA